MEKGEIAHNQQFILFSTVFSTLPENFQAYLLNLKLLSEISLGLEESKPCPLGKG